MIETDILVALDAAKTRATYGAIAGHIGVPLVFLWTAGAPQVCRMTTGGTAEARATGQLPVTNGRTNSSTAPLPASGKYGWGCGLPSM